MYINKGLGSNLIFQKFRNKLFFPCSFMEQTSYFRFDFFIYKKKLLNNSKQSK